MEEQSSTATLAPETPAAATEPTKAEVRAAQVKANREAKEAAKAQRKLDLAAKRADGIIGTLKHALGTAEGITKNEILAQLTKKFPTRDPIGMSTTVGIQLSRLQKTEGKIISYKSDARGRVYGFEKTLVIPQIVVEGTPEPEAAPATAEVPSPEPAPEPEVAVAVEETPAPKGKKGKGKK